MSAESEENVSQETGQGNTVGDGVMRAEDEGAERLLMEKDGAEERSLIGSESCVYLFGDLPLPPSIRGRNHPKGGAPAGYAAKVREAVECGVDAGREERVTLLYCVKRVTPLLDGCVAGDLCCKRMVSGKVLVEKTEELFKGAEGTEEIAGLEFESLKFRGSRRHDVFPFQVSGKTDQSIDEQMHRTAVLHSERPGVPVISRIAHLIAFCPQEFTAGPTM
jgi:hypothetical protein